MTKTKTFISIEALEIYLIRESIKAIKILEKLVKIILKILRSNGYTDFWSCGVAFLLQKHGSILKFMITVDRKVKPKISLIPY